MKGNFDLTFGNEFGNIRQICLSQALQWFNNFQEALLCEEECLLLLCIKFKIYLYVCPHSKVRMEVKGQLCTQVVRPFSK